MADERTQIIKVTFELLRTCNEILLDEREINASGELSELGRQYRRWLIQEAKTAAAFAPEKYEQ